MSVSKGGAPSRKTNKLPVQVQSRRWWWCRTCGKRTFQSRRAAKRATSMLKGVGLHTYHCPTGDGFHRGHLPPGVLSGEEDRRAYERRANQRTLKDAWDAEAPDD